MHHWCHLGPCTYGGGKHMSALQSAMNENNREPTNIALALHNQVLATEGQPPHQGGHPEYTQDLPLEGPPMPILSKTPAPPTVKSRYMSISLYNEDSAYNPSLWEDVLDRMSI